MVKALIKSTNVVRFERLEDVEEFHKQLKQRAIDGDYELTDFKYSVKFVKEKGEIIQEFYVVTYSNTLDDVKEPSYDHTDVEYVYESGKE